MTAISTRNLSRLYQARLTGAEVLALDDVSLEVEAGEVRGLLGPNGAGKTTLTKILSTVLLPTRGSATVLGFDVGADTAQVRKLIGVVFGGDKGLNTHLTGRQTLEFWAALYFVPSRQAKARAAALLDRVGLGPKADQVVSSYSRGMKQRLHLARGLIADARVLFLDEPTIGMDPMAARHFRELIRELRAEGKTILLTTHDMAEAEALCDRVALIDQGRLLAVETPASLGRLIAKHERIDFEGASEGLLNALRAHPGIAQIKTQSGGEGKGYRLEVKESGAHRSVLQLLVSSGITSIRTSRPSLEEVYLHVIGDRGFAVKPELQKA
jgi:ABC-2 type transport system ATP-binding protein